MGIGESCIINQCLKPGSYLRNTLVACLGRSGMWCFRMRREEISKGLDYVYSEGMWSVLPYISILPSGFEMLRSFIFYGTTCLIRLIDFAALFTAFEESVV